MTESELNELKQRGELARQLLKNPLIVGAFDDIRQLLYKKIAQSSFDQATEREDCYRMLRAVEMFEGMFKRHINTGVAAEDKLSMMQKIVKRVQEL